MAAEPGEGPGLVTLVGAGPGDPGLLTLRGRRAIERADLVLYDKLASPSLLAAVPVPGQERIHVGKAAGRGLSKQADIEALMLRRAREGARVVRLKGGDPFVFGRGGEEAEACLREGVPFEFVPGVTSVCAVPAFAGIPLTHRDLTSCFTVATGQERTDGGAPGVPWEMLARAGGTVVVLMGVRRTADWARELMEGGLDPDTPVALIRWGATPRQQTLEATLGTLADRVAETGFRPPATAVVGEVVRRRRALAWVERRPLFGQVIAVTRSRTGGLEDFEPLEDLGAAVAHVPLTRQQAVEEGGPLTRAVEAGGFTDLVVTSANGVGYLARALEAAGRDARDLAGVTTWAVGPATARALRDELGLAADRVPTRQSGRGLVELAGELGVTGRRFLFPAAAAARRTVPDGLRALGASVDEVPAYETVHDPAAPARLESALEQGLTMAAVASPSAVDALVGALETLDRDRRAVPVACIGPTTAEHAREAGLEVVTVAQTHTMAGLARAIAAREGAGEASEAS